MSWNCGSQEQQTELCPAMCGQSLFARSRLQEMLPKLSITPFGSPVLPDVYCRNAMSSSQRASKHRLSLLAPVASISRWSTFGTLYESPDGHPLEAMRRRSTS
jgi:hypothetical protein